MYLGYIRVVVEIGGPRIEKLSTIKEVERGKIEIWLAASGTSHHRPGLLRLQNMPFLHDVFSVAFLFHGCSVNVT